MDRVFSRFCVPTAYILAVSALLAGCGGGGGHNATIPAKAASAPAAHGRSTVSISLAIPTSRTHPSARIQRSAMKQPSYVSPASRSVAIAVNGESAIVQDLGRQQPGCDTATSGEVDCTVPASVPVGTDDFVVTVYDGATASGNRLSRGEATVAVDGSPQTIPIVLDSFVAAVAITIPPGTAPPCSFAQYSVPVSITAKDADGYVITGPGKYVNSITLSDSDHSGATTLSTTTVDDPSTAVTLAYNSTAYDKSAAIGATAENLSSSNVTQGVLDVPVAAELSYTIQTDSDGTATTANVVTTVEPISALPPTFSSISEPVATGMLCVSTTDPNANQFSVMDAGRHTRTGTIGGGGTPSPAPSPQPSPSSPPIGPPGVEAGALSIYYGIDQTPGGDSVHIYRWDNGPRLEVIYAQPQGYLVYPFSNTTLSVSPARTFLEVGDGIVSMILDGSGAWTNPDPENAAHLVQRTESMTASETLSALPGWCTANAEGKPVANVHDVDSVSGKELYRTDTPNFWVTSTTTTISDDYVVDGIGPACSSVAQSGTTDFGGIYQSPFSLSSQASLTGVTLVYGSTSAQARRRSASSLPGGSATGAIAATAIREMLTQRGKAYARSHMRVPRGALSPARWAI